jgi:hypothetical protein
MCGTGVRFLTRERDRVWGPPSPPIQLLTVALTMEIKRPELEAASSADVQKGAVPPSPPIRLRGAALGYFSGGGNLYLMR